RVDPGLDARPGERPVHLRDRLVVLRLLADVPDHELQPLDRGHVLEAVAEEAGRRQLAVRLALHHLVEGLEIARRRALLAGVGRDRGGRHGKPPSSGSTAYTVT